MNHYIKNLRTILQRLCYLMLELFQFIFWIEYMCNNNGNLSNAYKILLIRPLDMYFNGNSEKRLENMYFGPNLLESKIFFLCLWIFQPFLILFSLVNNTTHRMNMSNYRSSSLLKIPSHTQFMLYLKKTFEQSQQAISSHLIELSLKFYEYHQVW